MEFILWKPISVYVRVCVCVHACATVRAGGRAGATCGPVEQGYYRVEDDILGSYDFWLVFSMVLGT